MKSYKKLLSTTTNQSVLEAAKSSFINYIPRLLEVAISNDLSQTEIDECNALDFFDYHFRAYVCGKVNRTHRVYHELRNLIAHNINPTSIIEKCESDLIENELYEYLPRFIWDLYTCLTHAMG